jgi:hypothetical protein
MPPVRPPERGPRSALERPKSVLLNWTPIGAGYLVGKATARLPIGLEIADIGVFQKDGRRWAQLPSEPLRDYATGQPLKDDRGKPKYRSSIKWQTRELQERFSAVILALIEAAYPDALDDGGAS